MYCPQCAAPQTDAAKFCRSCGFALGTAALAVGGPAAKPTRKGSKERETIQDWLEFQAKRTGGIVRGGVLLGVSAFVAVPMALFMPSRPPWVAFWTVFFGWLACWGAVEMAFGLGGLLEAKTRIRMLTKAPPTGLPLLAEASREGAIDGIPAEIGTAPMSVTENTTRHLADSRTASSGKV